MRLHRQVARYFVILLIPSRKSVTFAFRVCRSDSRFAVLYRLALEDSIVVIHEGDRVGINGAVVSRRIGSITCYSYDSRCPACEGVGKLSRSRFGGVSMGRRLTVLYYRLVNRTAIVILPSDGVATQLDAYFLRGDVILIHDTFLRIIFTTFRQFYVTVNQLYIQPSTA